MELLDRASELSIGVAGDLILDRYTRGAVSRISPEAPVPVIHAKSSSEQLGGAGNSAQAIAELGSEVTIFGRIGNDPTGQTVRALLNQQGIDLLELPQFEGYPTTVKTRYIADSQHLLRVDEERRKPIQLNNLQQIEEKLRKTLSELDGLLISDYGKGVFSPETLGFWLELTADLDLPVVVDPVPDHFEQYENATLMTPNTRELLEGSRYGPTDDRPMLERARGVVDELKMEAVLVTRGEQGMTLVSGDNEPEHLDTEAREVYDVTGAGDTVAAIMAMGEAGKLDRKQTMKVANTAAGIVVGRMGTVVVEPEELREALGE